MRYGIFAAALSALPALAGVVVNEVMFNPSVALGDDANYEWVEIHNDGATAVDISGWSISDLDGSSNCVAPSGTTIPAYGYLVFARDEDSFVSHYGASVPRVAWTGSWGSGLGNDGDQVALRDAAMTTIDQVEYDDTPEWGSDYGDDNTYPDMDGDGATLERIAPGGTTQDPENWEASIDEDSGIPDANWPGHDESHGTPGAVNSVSTGALESGTWAGIKSAF